MSEPTKEYVDSAPTASEMKELGERTEAEPVNAATRVDDSTIDEMSDEGSGTLSVRDIARVCHNVNRAYSKTLGETSLKPWDEEYEAQHKSLMTGVRNRIDNPGMTAEDAHTRWLEFKKSEGWVQGDVRDVAKKTHPNMVPYHLLPDAQQVKDVLFATIVDELKDL